ncbi:hypothetical protein [Rhodobacter sp. SY28-1]|nr:hypothetical protein [Rhodobacter sp. SY28-1]
MTRSRLLLAWCVRAMQRTEDPTLERFGNLRIDQSKKTVPLFYARKAA